MLPLLLIACLSPQSTEAGRLELERTWDARKAEHLMNRAGFGAGPRELARAVELGPMALVEELLEVDPWLEQPFYARVKADQEVEQALDARQRRERVRQLREEDKAQATDFVDWWFERMLSGSDPLVERMTLFWHGHFTSSMDQVKSSYAMIRQNQLFRRLGLGSFRELLSGVAHDPAMLVYLDNDSSKKGNPNENFARELMELFTLGEGHYSENDVREVARAFTGWSQRQGRFRMNAGQHDRDRKQVLGVSGRLDGDDVIDILLDQPACATHIAGRLITYFEGCEPQPERLEAYAQLLRQLDYRLDLFLRELFLDPAFYRDEVIGTRIASPVDFLVGVCRRLGVTPGGRLVALSADLMGEELFHPPGVKGWEGGRSWVAGCAPQLPGMLAGVLLGELRARDLSSEWVALSEPELDASQEGEVMVREASASARKRLPPELRTLSRLPWRSRLNLTARLRLAGAEDDHQLAAALAGLVLATPATPELLQRLEENLRERREELGLSAQELLGEIELSEPLLRELAYQILCLPEARLH